MAYICINAHKIAIKHKYPHSSLTVYTQKRPVPHKDSYSAIWSKIEKKPIRWKAAKKDNYVCHGSPECLLHNRVSTPIKMEGRVFILGAAKQNRYNIIHSQEGD